MKRIVHSAEEAAQAIRESLRKWFAQLKPVFDKNTALLESHIKYDLMTGGHPLKARTGRLKSSTKFIPAKITKNGIKSGIKFGTKYARVHIGPPGQVTTIKPKRSKYLAIPLPAAMTSKGVAKGSPRDESVFGNTDVIRSKSGKLIIVGYNVYQKGKSAGKMKGNKLIPLFVLLKQVKINAKISTHSLIGWARLRIIRDIKKLRVA